LGIEPATLPEKRLNDCTVLLLSLSLIVGLAFSRLKHTAITKASCGETVLQTGMTELVGWPYGTEHVTAMGVLEKFHQVYGHVPFNGYLD